MKKLHTAIRITVLGAMFVLICALYLVSLVNIQITGQDYYDIIKAENYTRYVSIDAKRGEIYDRNGKALVINTEAYDISLEYGAMPSEKAEFNDVILNSRIAICDGGGADNLTTQNFPFHGYYPSYTKDSAFFESSSNEIKYNSLLKRLELDENIKTEDLIDTLRVRYGLATWDKKTKTYTDLYPSEQADILMRIRFDMEYLQFSRVEPYTLATAVDISTLTFVKELSINQIIITVEAARTYVYDGYASHILGRIGKIPSEKADEYKALGYSGDAYVGISGAEEVYEEYLHGTDGTMAIVEDAYGNIVSETVVKEPVPGNDVYLTIDMDLQITAEDALKDNIQIIVEKGENAKDKFSGEDANSGAAVAVDPVSGEVLAMASYPTFNLSEYVKNYTAYAEDELRPLYNRALYGTYAPGSTFKPGVAAAALNEGIITTNTIIVDKGVYHFGDYNPRCWIYLLRGATHGAQNVVLAIQNSCNYFFYEVGRQLGIESMNRYCRMYGLGEATGIELGESVGILAGPDYSESVGNVWNPGNTLQAAIGQSDNTFTPIQLSGYISTLINGGTRYRAHLLKYVKSFPSGDTLLEKTPEILNIINFKDYITGTIKNAMKDVVESGSAARIFRGYDITVGGKTGTAQVGTDRSDNALFTGFAPFENPKMVVTVVIEQGANGTDAAYTAKAMFDRYLKGEAYETLAEQAEKENADD